MNGIAHREPSPDDLLSLADAAAYLSLGKSSLSALAAAGAVPYYTPGPARVHRRFRRSDLDAYLAGCRSDRPREAGPPRLRVAGRPDGRPLRWA